MGEFLLLCAFEGKKLQKKKKNSKNNVNKCKDKKREKISTLTDSASRTAKSV